MALITIPEFMDVLIMSACVGYIFTDYFARFNIFRKPRDFVQSYVLKRKFIMSDFLFSIYLVAPAIILHELAHKFTAMYFGFDATFFSAISVNKLIYGMSFFDFASILMIVALVSTYFGGKFLFFVPAYVSFAETATPAQTSVIAFAGPLMNLLLWQGSAMLLRARKISNKYVPFAIITSKINMLLFIFNMIPLPGFDGEKVLSGIFRTIF